MENNEFKKVCIKDCMCCYFNDIIRLEDFDLDNIFIDEKSHENILIYVILYKTLIDPKPLRIRFDQINGLIRISDGTGYLTLFGSEEYEAIYNRTRYLISLKVASHVFFLTILRKSKLILMILYLWQKDCPCIMLHTLNQF